MKKFMALMAGAVLIGFFGCGTGDDDDDDNSPTPTPSPTAGTVTAEGSNITGSNGLILLGSITVAQDRVAGICELIQTDPANVTAVFLEPQSMMDPCSLGTPVTLDPGNYTATFGTYTPGQQTPMQCATATFDLDGATTFTIPALGSCS